jgi:hypothetical protein
MIATPRATSAWVCAFGDVRDCAIANLGSLDSLNTHSIGRRCYAAAQVNRTDTPRR